jgi:hypothetical protein
MMKDELRALWSHRCAMVERFIAEAEQYKECVRGILLGTPKFI